MIKTLMWMWVICGIVMHYNSIHPIMIGIDIVKVGTILAMVSLLGILLGDAESCSSF